MNYRKILTILLGIGLIMLAGGLYIESRISKKYSPSASNSSGFSSQVSTGDVIVKADDLQLVFTKTKWITETYMVFGISESKNGNPLSNGFLAGIPLQQAKSLLRKYPQMSRCGAPGSEEAKQAIQNFMLFTDSSQVHTKLAEIANMDQINLRQGNLRICVQINGDLLKFKEGRDNNGQQVGFQVPGNIIKLQRIEVVPCI